MEKSKQLNGLYETKQLVEKLSINSIYGALGNAYFPLFNQEMARAITGNGRYYIQKMSKYIEKGLKDLDPSNDYMIYNDTDSGYFTIAPFVEKAFKDKPQATLTEKTDFCNRFYEQIVDPMVQASIDDFGNECNAYNTDVIGCEREIIAQSAVFTNKKKYFARVIDSEGVRYSPWKMKVMGLDIIRSGTPPLVKTKLKSSLDIILDSPNADHLITWVDEVQQEFVTVPIANISKVQGVSNIDYNLQTDKGVPIGARASLVHNAYTKANGLQNEFDDIQAGDKVKMIYLQEPNPLHSNIVAYKNDRFIELFKDYIDYDLCFDKFFLSPLEIMSTALNWDIRKTTESLDDW